MPRAEEITWKITANAPLSIPAIKEPAIKGAEMGLEELKFAQNKRNEVLASEDAQEGGPLPKSARPCGRAASIYAPTIAQNTDVTALKPRMLLARMGPGLTN